MPIWDREDETEWEKYQRTKGRQGRPAPPPQGEAEEEPSEKEPLLGKLLGRLRPERAEAPEDPPEICPWCGGEMSKGYLMGDHGIYWSDQRPKWRRIGISDNIFVDNEGGGFNPYKTVWHCAACRKLVMDTASLAPPLGPPHGAAAGEAGPAETPAEKDE